MTTKSEEARLESYQAKAASGLPGTFHSTMHSFPVAWLWTRRAPGGIGKFQGEQPCTALGKTIG